MMGLTLQTPNRVTCQIYVYELHSSRLITDSISMVSSLGKISYF